MYYICGEVLFALLMPRLYSFDVVQLMIQIQIRIQNVHCRMCTAECALQHMHCKMCTAEMRYACGKQCSADMMKYQLSNPAWMLFLKITHYIATRNNQFESSIFLAYYAMKDIIVR